MNDKQTQALAHLGLILHEVPAAKRPGLSASIDGLLKLAGLELKDHPYFLGSRFKHLIPSIARTPAMETRRLRYSLAEGRWPEEAQEYPFIVGWASQAEVAQVLKRSTKMVELYLKDKKRRDPRNDMTHVNVTYQRKPLILRFEFPPLTPSEREIADEPNLTEGLKLTPSLVRGGKAPSSY